MYELLEATIIPTGKAQPSIERGRQSTSMSTDSDDPEVEEVERSSDWHVTTTQKIGLHVQGMQSLVKMREPASFQTEMDKALLCSLLEAFVRYFFFFHRASLICSQIPCGQPSYPVKRQIHGTWPATSDNLAVASRLHKR